eukprot:TRINITY_DN1626_c0_g1_i1.p2 TRINITY_DN1626_c0_g1~~TRINITY_DN1626_c0_g1_i1.p2  ORF type:complete len:102 (-),score=43.56 TRINITY_DN1626_c0_g1_i1:33-338(-)
MVYSTTLFSKHSGTTMAPPNLVAMTELPGVWAVGYGLDDGGEKRGWPHLFACPKIEGVPKVPADDAFGCGDASNSKAREAWTTLREAIVGRLATVKADLDA